MHAETTQSFHIQNHPEVSRSETASAYSLTAVKLKSFSLIDLLRTSKVLQRTKKRCAIFVLAILNSQQF